jgi:signal transduction histidine kinase
MRWDARRWAGTAVLFVAYATTAKVGLSFDAVSGVATAVWPPTGISLCALALFGFELWPGIALAAFLVNAQTGIPLLAAVGIAAGNTLEAVAGAWLLRRVGFGPSLARIRDALALIFLAAFLSTTISASFGAISLFLTGGFTNGSFREVWWVWWVGDVCGDLLVAPVLLAWLAGGPVERRPVRLLELGLLVAAAIGVGVFAFGDAARLYLVFPVVLWAGLRFGPRGASAATLLLAIVAILDAADVPSRHLVETQLFIAVVAVTSLLLGAAVAERQRAVHLRDEFLSVASHELRTPLAALKLRVQGVHRSLQKSGAEDKVVARLAATDGQIDRLEKLIDELLDVSRITAGRLHLERTEVKLAALVKDVAARLRPAGDVALDLDDTLTGVWDPLRIEQVVTNLLGNALQHGSPPFRVSLRRVEANAELVVSDGGAGVRPEDRRRVFERFEQRADGRRSTGLGLGLYIASQIIQAHGGSITVAGATFTVCLPLTVT